MQNVRSSVRGRAAARGGVLALATVTAAGAALLVAPAAHAETVDVAYSCQSPIGKKDAVSPIDITSVPSGSGYRLTMTFKKGVSSSPIELGKGAMNPSATIKVGGADPGTVSVAGAPNDAAIPANTPIKINDLTGTYTPKKSGKVTFTAGVLTIKALGTVTTCNATNSPKPSLSLDVTAAGGSGGATAPSGADTLPQTGPADSAVALGTFGGTVLLAGVAGVLWLTRRAARTR
ncbi:LPXTG cell wall anchor domain-containing protein [Streptomyces sp. NPDC006733]|uniref:LPXTG cell wall anchor domain-containing protein n=1 Tax=Streptomyces sp. NPDC006733 TaxID=3155460 RepID=UPI0033E43EED